MSKKVNPAFGTNQAMPLQGFQDQAGWEFFEEQLGLKPDAAQDEINTICAIAAHKFSDEAGIKLLDYLCDQTLRKPVVLSGLGIDPMQAYAHGCQREGQNNLMFLILKLIAAGRNEETPNREIV